MVLSNTAVPTYYGEFRDKVLRGEIPVNYEVSLQMNRIDDDIANPDFYYDNTAIDGFIRFCENELTLVDGRPLTLLPSFKLWAEDVIGWYHFVEEKFYNPKSGRYEKRRVKKRLRQKQYLIVSRGNAKSLYETCHQGYGLVCDTTTTQQVTTAPTVRQAEEVISPLITAMARKRGPVFKALCGGSNMSRNPQTQPRLAPTKDGAINRLTNSTLSIIPMSINKMQGSRAKYATVDEWLSGVVREDPFEALEQSAAKDGISDYLIIGVSSEGTIRDSVGDTIKMNLLKILRGDVYDPSTSIWYYKLDDVKEVANPDMWMKACPNIGVTVSYDTYEKAVRTAENFPDKRNDILAKRFGIAVEGFTQYFTYEETVLPIPHLSGNADKMACAMGMDASQGDDFWAFTWVFPIGQGRYAIKTRSYVSDLKMRKLPTATVNKFKTFVEEGSLVVCEGAILDWQEIYEDVNNYIDEHQWDVVTFGYDPYNAGAFVERWISENGEFGVEVVRQGYKTESVPLGELKKLASNQLLLFDEYLMQFAMGNSIALQDNNGNLKLDKTRQVDKIDNVAAMMDAWVAYTRNKEAFE